MFSEVILEFFLEHFKWGNKTFSNVLRSDYWNLFWNIFKWSDRTHSNVLIILVQMLRKMELKKRFYDETE